MRGVAARLLRRAAHIFVIAGLVPAIPLRMALCVPKRDGRDEPGHDRKNTALAKGLSSVRRALHENGSESNAEHRSIGSLIAAPPVRGGFPNQLSSDRCEVGYAEGGGLQGFGLRDDQRASVPDFL